MTDETDDNAAANMVTSIEELEALYAAPQRRSLIKEIDHVSDHYRQFIEKAPFVVVGTAGPEGLECSPRGDPPGSFRVPDPKTVLIPDRRGNNRIDSLRNIVRDPRIALLFLIPGAGETLRVNGHARISVDTDLCASFAMDGKAPTSVIVVSAERVYFQCQKALVRSRLWQSDAHIERGDLPTAGEMLQALDAGPFDAEYPERMKKTLY